MTQIRTDNTENVLLLDVLDPFILSVVVVINA